MLKDMTGSNNYFPVWNFLWSWRNLSISNYKFACHFKLATSTVQKRVATINCYLTFCCWIQHKSFSSIVMANMLLMSYFETVNSRNTVTVKQITIFILNNNPSLIRPPNPHLLWEKRCFLRKRWPNVGEWHYLWVRGGRYCNDIKLWSSGHFDQLASYKFVWQSDHSPSVCTVNFLNVRTPKKFVVITLKFELCSSTIE